MLLASTPDSGFSVDEIVAMLTDPAIKFTTTPENVEQVRRVHAPDRLDQQQPRQLEGRVLSRDPLGSRQLMPLLEVAGVTLQYRTTDRVVTATRGVSFSVDTSDRFVILGPSGCGKSTILKAVAGFVAPVEGRILLNGTPVTAPGPGSHRRLPGIRSAAAVEDGAAKHHVCLDRRRTSAGAGGGRLARATTSRR